MLKVPAFVHPSKIPGAGLGLFARYKIPAGTLVWEYDEDVDYFVPLEALQGMDEPTKAYLDRYGYVLPGSHQVEVCGDLAMFFNHADKPNCDELPGITVANCDIEAGEELTCDYRLIESRHIPFLDHGGSPCPAKNVHVREDPELPAPISA